MINKENTYKTAFENKKKRLKEQERQRELMLNAAYTTNPRLEVVERELSSLGASLAITALTGDLDKLKEFEKRSKLLAAEKAEILKKAQVPEIQYECNLCCDSGLVSGKICECVRKEAGKILMAELSKNMPLENCRFENFDLKYYSDKTDALGDNPRKEMTKILKFCKEYVLNFKPETAENLIFRGSPGLGKTHLTMAMVSGVIEKGYLPVYGSAQNLFSAVESERFSSDKSDALETMLQCDLLVIDDLGTELVTSFTRSVLYNLINTRILCKKPTIINTNLELEELKDTYTNRIASRFMGEYTWKEFCGKDIRLQKALNK
jgi:DNA replication protein DnaC